MLRHTVPAFVLAILTSVSAWSRADDLVAVGSASTRIMTPLDSSGDVWYSIKIPVTNNSKSHVDVRLELQALDKDGFEIESVSLSASVPPGETYMLSDRTYMSGKDLHSVAKWALEDVRANETIGPKVTLIEGNTKMLTRPDSSGDIWFAVKAASEEDLKEVYTEVAETIGRPIFEKLARGPRQRTDRIARRLNDGTEVDIYGLVLHALAHIRPGLVTLEYEELRSAIRDISKDPPQLHEVARVLRHMASIAASDESSTPVIDFEEEEKVLHVTDPFFAFYLRWGNLNG